MKSLPAEQHPAGAVAETGNTSSMFMRLLKDPDVSAEKLEKFVALQYQADARESEALFNASMSECQSEMRPVATDSNNPQTKSRYASYAALDKALRPIYTRHGFALSFDTAESKLADHILVLCYVTAHKHTRTYRVDMPADGKGAKGGDVMTKTHAAGAAMSYGMRYLLKMIFNVSVGEDDDDGNGATAVERITEAEALNLCSLLDGISPVYEGNETGTKQARAETERRFLDYLAKLGKVKIQRVEDIPKNLYTDALNRIKQARK